MRTQFSHSFPGSSLGTHIPEAPLRSASRENRIHCTRASGSSASEDGFTLLELLIAIGLTSILMIALFSAMQIYFNLQLDGHEEITRQQIARTLLRQMTRDIQSTVFVKKETTDEDDSSSSGSSGSTGTSNSTNHRSLSSCRTSNPPTSNPCCRKCLSNCR